MTSEQSREYEKLSFEQASQIRLLYSNVASLNIVVGHLRAIAEILWTLIS